MDFFLAPDCCHFLVPKRRPAVQSLSHPIFVILRSTFFGRVIPELKILSITIISYSVIKINRNTFIFQNGKQAIYGFNILSGAKYSARLKKSRTCPPLKQKGVLIITLTLIT